MGLINYLKYKIVGVEINEFKGYKHIFKNKVGLEIGGPSPIFKRKRNLPIYNLTKKIDGCNFSNKTIWEGDVNKNNFYFKRKHKQFVSDGTDLSKLEDGTYDFVISSNCLEHIANPLKALNEWLRVLKPDGHILIVVPNSKTNFDHARPVTTIDHLLEDLKNNTDEKDLTHLEEILKLHDLSMDKPAGSLVNFKHRSLDNFNNRALHHHVFDLDLLTSIFKLLNIKVLFTKEMDNFIIFGQKK